ncbi:MAG: STAS domain-containing protein [Chitinivibrionales bacterium]
MLHKPSQLPKDTYHRLYWYAQRNVDPHRIAAALNLPVKTVLHLISRLKSETVVPPVPTQKTAARLQRKLSEETIFLDIFVFSKTRYTVIDINGFVCKETIPKLRQEFEKIAGAGWLPLALRMTDVQNIDTTGIDALLSLHRDFKENGRYLAILDPSPGLEPFFKQHDLDEKIPIFGTEQAFEESAFS